ncbi:MAG: ABC transporter permease subunit [Muricomes sp.]
MTKQRNIETKGIFVAISALFLVFLLYPMIKVLTNAFVDNNTISFQFVIEVITGKNFAAAVGNSLVVSLASAGIATLLAFTLAYSIHYTNLPYAVKKGIEVLAVLPMLLPTITYGFAIIYSFGKQGLLTKLFGAQLFDIYGYSGLIIGYVIYTLPISFMLIHNTMGYIDKKFMIVSQVMGDNKVKIFYSTILRPLSSTFAASMIQCFFLSFTDYGIPASVGGKVQVIVGLLYDEMLGSIPNFNNGAVIALIMLLPSIVSIAILQYLERYNVRYTRISVIELKKNKVRDISLGVASAGILACVLSVFAVIFLVPFIKEWPYRLNFTLENVKNVLTDSALTGVYRNSLYVAILTAVIGTLIVYGGALVTARSNMSGKYKRVIEGTAMVTNTIPGMVLGIAFMLAFTGTSLQGSFAIMILCNIVHFFSTPYLMMKGSLEKMNASWETTARLMGDNWVKTVLRIVTPNTFSTLLESFSYFFINAMVTVSAVIFIVGARTMILTAKIKELQHYTKFNEVFVLSLLILFTNLLAKGILQFLANKNKRKKKEDKK